MNLNKRYSKSIHHLNDAEIYIPLGAQTLSKSKFFFTPGLAPLYSNKAQGSKIWDLDGNEYVDLVNSLAAVTLGHADQDISDAVKKQIDFGTTISLSHPIELEVAKLLNSLVPSADMIRFGKNGSDATSAAVRVARAYTKRDKVIVCGYHGWHDWYIGSTPRGRGVPKPVSDLAVSVPYNNLEVVEKLLETNSFAALILEPMNAIWPEPGYLEGLRELCTKFGTVLIFDETITGFRLAKGGAQEFFNVIPDLSTFGKGIANGYPLSAVVGNHKIMKLFEDVFFSGTFGGELLSLTAASVVLEKVKNDNVITKLGSIGKDLNEKITSVIEECGLRDVLRLSGHNSWKFLNWNLPNDQVAAKVKALFQQEMSKNGVLLIATHNISTSIDERDINTIQNAYKISLSTISKALKSENIESFLEIDRVEYYQALR